MMDPLLNFARLMVEIGEYYQKPLTSVLCHLYWQDLKAVPPENLRAAWQQHRQHPHYGPFFPKPADLLRHLEDHYRQQYEETWQQLLQALQQGQDPCDLPADIQGWIKKLGGWHYLSHCSWQSLRKLQADLRVYYLEKRKKSHNNALPIDEACELKLKQKAPFFFR